jgi:hypothetical protein
MATHPTDYVVIREESSNWDRGTKLEAGPVPFKLPAKTVPDDPSVLFFVLSLSGVEKHSVKLRVRLNGKSVWSATFGSITRWGTFHTIVGKNMIEAGENVLNFDMYDWDKEDIPMDANFSEVVLFYKVRDLS